MSAAKSRPSDPALLALYPLFANMSRTQIEQAQGHMRLQSFPAGRTIWEEGEAGDEVCLLLEGKVVISQQLTLFSEAAGDMEAKDKSIIHLDASQRPVIGEIALCAHTPRSASLISESPVQLALFRERDLERLIEQDPGFGMLLYRNLAQIIAERLIEANRNVLKLTTAFSLALGQSN